MPLHWILLPIFLFGFYSKFTLNWIESEKWKINTEKCEILNVISIDSVEWKSKHRKSSKEPSWNQCIHKMDITTLNLYATAYFPCIQCVKWFIAFVFDLTWSVALTAVWTKQKGFSFYLLLQKGNFGRFSIPDGISFLHSYLLKIYTNLALKWFELNLFLSNTVSQKQTLQINTAEPLKT